SGGACAYLRRQWASRQDTPWTECQPIAGYTHTLIHSRNHTHYTQFRDANQPTWGRKPEYLEETPQHGENMQTPHTHMAEVFHTLANQHGRGRESNPRPWRCEANVLTTKPPCTPRAVFNLPEENAS
ncbi:hypothetical protein QTP70_029475, partial [Hemibagrus guttatus]